MYGGLSREGLKKLEIQIDEQLSGRDPKSSLLEKNLKDLIEKYSYEVEYYNTIHRKLSYENKYGTSVPLKYRASLSLANFMAHGIPMKDRTTAVPKGKHPVTAESMDKFIKGYTAILQGKASAKDVKNVIKYDPNPKQLASSIFKKISKIGMFFSSNASTSDKYPVTPLQSSLLEGFVGYKKLR